MCTNYTCNNCKAVDCKLWRPAHVLADQVDLVCWRCLESLGHEVEYGQPCGSDQVYDPKIGPENWVPAVPDLNGQWWGYTSVPIWWVNWWRSLPNKKEQCTSCCGSKKIGDYTCFTCHGSGLRAYFPESFPKPLGA